MLEKPLNKYHGIILTGPTASGKSAAALELAQHVKGEIINADSMQLYQHLPLLTACPSHEDLTHTPHHLYRILKENERGSVGWWYPQAINSIEDVLSRNRVPIIVGGTGMYLSALLNGLAVIPPIAPLLREQVRNWAEEPDFYQRVLTQDPEAAMTLKPNDKQRLTRALEVKLATGQSIRFWQKQTQKLKDYTFLVLALIPERDILYQRINQRFLQMIDQGVIREVESFLALKIPEDSPISRAVGLPEIMAYLQHKIDLETAISSAQQASRRYAKRQITWIRHQLPQAFTLSEWSERIKQQTREEFYLKNQ
jgi:tRNA dimethylallyltransferase